MAAEPPESPPQAEPPQTKANGRPGRRSLAVLLVIVLVAVTGLAALVVWALTRPKEAPVSANQAFARYEPGWTSAMEKAGVEATFPSGPIDLTALRPTGRQPFEATFTPEEITALMNVYPYVGESEQFTFENAAVTFPQAGVATLSARITIDGTAYSAQATAPVTHSPKGVSSPGLTSLSVEGFPVTGERRQQASDAVIAYVNAYLRAAPGLTIEQARIVDGGLEVEGMAPTSLEYPDQSAPAP